MSQFGLLIVTDKETVNSACRGWLPPLSTPIQRSTTNPFTGEPLEITSYVPDGIEDIDCAPLDDVTDRLRTAKPLAVDFQLSPLLRKDFLDDSKPFLIGNDERGTVMIDQVPSDLEAKVVGHFGEQLGEYADLDRLRSENLSMFVLVYDF